MKHILIILIILNGTLYCHEYKWLSGVLVGTGYVSDGIFNPDKYGIDIDIQAYHTFINGGYSQTIYINSKPEYKFFAGIGIGNLIALQAGSDLNNIFLRFRIDALSFEYILEKIKFLNNIHFSFYYEYHFNDIAISPIKLGFSYSLFD